MAIGKGQDKQVHDRNKSESMRRLQAAVEKWTFGINVVICLMVLIAMMTWRVMSLPEDDNGGGMVGAMVVGIIELIRILLVLGGYAAGLHMESAARLTPGCAGSLDYANNSSAMAFTRIKIERGSRCCHPGP
jgi:hypothetical protein